MPNIEFIHPLQQPVGTFRLLDWLKESFQSDDYHQFRCLTAFAKVTPFYKLHSSIQVWNAKGNHSEAVIGIDHMGTSYQALQYALMNFHAVRILHTELSTFHPKLYLFYGENKAAAYYGSGNLTSGGLETNFEGGIIVYFDLPGDQALFDSLVNGCNALWEPNVPCAVPLTAEFLEKLKTNGLLLDETVQTRLPRVESTAAAASREFLFRPFPVKPASAIPKEIMTSAAVHAGLVLRPTVSKQTGVAPTGAVGPVVLPLVVDGLVIQISPHHNGEIFLSKLAVDQNRSFFGYPFTGRTVPKKAGNPTYPQRVPDPVVNIRVYDAAGVLVNTEKNYNLNTVFYEKKSEIRITVTSSILSGLRWTTGSTDYPILVMRRSDVIGCDYEMDFYAKGSTVYQNYLNICNQVLPSGGKAVARRMGWI